ncbi:MAG: hypothetical protein EOO41_01140 [Methanobacteriota archaeon]|nr:MAG: hypothetical protein EOO41_01140 [Euryarchaeota archaeon]
MTGSCILGCTSTPAEDASKRLTPTSVSSSQPDGGAGTTSSLSNGEAAVSDGAKLAISCCSGVGSASSTCQPSPAAASVTVTIGSTLSVAATAC